MGTATKSVSSTPRASAPKTRSAKTSSASGKPRREKVKQALKDPAGRTRLKKLAQNKGRPELAQRIAQAAKPPNGAHGQDNTGRKTGVGVVDHAPVDNKVPQHQWYHRLTGQNPPGYFAGLVRQRIRNPPPGTRNDAILDLPKHRPDVFEKLSKTPVGTSMTGDRRADAFANNSFHNSRVPELSLYNPQEFGTYHHYEVLTHLGKADGKIDRNFVLREGLLKRHSLPSYNADPAPADFAGRSKAYAPQFGIGLGDVQQERVTAGAVNITDENHAAYPGTIRRTIIEHNGHLFVHTLGAGHTIRKNFVGVGMAAGNDTLGPQAFQVVDKRLAQWLQSQR